jgi:hypothetical protein
MKKAIPFILLFYSVLSFGQDKEEKVYEHFNNTRIINLQSVESLSPGIFELKISHRFGAVTEGPANLFGLDIATMRIGLEQGLTKNLMIGIGRSTYQKTYDGFVKYRILTQKEDGLKLAISFLSTINVNGLPFDKSRTNYFSSRLAYVNQFIFSSRLNERISLQLSPTVIHKNLVKYVADKNTTYALGFAGKYNLNKNISLNLEYMARLKQGVGTPTFTNNYNSLSAGMGIETKGHFFELHLTNSMPMVETGFITETKDTWLKGNIHPGFNIVRDFRVYKKR